MKSKHIASAPFGFPWGDIILPMPPPGDVSSDDLPV